MFIMNDGAIILFQFLIGRLETNAAYYCSRCYRRFQFLIGRLETAYHCVSFVTSSSFQFLIGRLETDSLSGPIPSECVSIPHR